MSIVCFIQGASYGLADSFLTAHLLNSKVSGRLRASKEALVPLPCRMRANVLESRLLCIIDDCVVDPVAAKLAFARAAKFDWTMPNCLCSLQHDLA